MAKPRVARVDTVSRNTRQPITPVKIPRDSIAEPALANQRHTTRRGRILAKPEGRHIQADGYVMVYCTRCAQPSAIRLQA